MQRLLIPALLALSLCGQDPEEPKLEPVKTSITVTEKITTEVPGVVLFDGRFPYIGLPIPQHFGLPRNFSTFQERKHAPLG